MLVPIEGVSDTPRTDDMEARHPLAWFNEFGRWSSSSGAWRYFARQLERELAESERQNKDLLAEIRKANDLQLAYEGVDLLYFAEMIEHNCCPLIRAAIAKAEGK